jgi:hypothetical protein
MMSLIYSILISENIWEWVLYLYSKKRKSEYFIQSSRVPKSL